MSTEIGTIILPFFENSVMTSMYLLLFIKVS